MTYVFGLGLGTSSLKGLLVDESGGVIESVVAEYELISEKAGHSEQDPACWVLAIESVLSTLTLKVPNMLERLKEISFSGQIHSLVLLDIKEKMVRRHSKRFLYFPPTPSLRIPSPRQPICQQVFY